MSNPLVSPVPGEVITCLSEESRVAFLGASWHLKKTARDVRCWRPPCSLSLAWESCTSAEPCPSWQLHTAACLHQGASIFSEGTDKCVVKWMVILQRLHIIRHKWRDEWSINGVILWSCMKESFEAVVNVCAWRLYSCNPLIAAAQLTKCVRPESEVCFVRNTSHLLLGLVYCWSCLGQLYPAVF